MDRFGHHAECVRYPGTQFLICRQLPGLHPLQDGHQGQVQHQYHDGQLPRVDGHDGQHDHDLDRIDDPGDGSPLGELGERLDVAGHPRRQHTLPRGRVLGEAQPVEMLEGPDPQAQ